MSERATIGALMMAVVTVFGGFTTSVGAQPRGDSGPGGDMIYPGTMGPGMMGRGRMGPGMMGPGMMPPSTPQSTGGLGAGEAIFRSQCAMCHTLQAGAPNTFGPNLHGLFGRKAGGAPGYVYSAAMRDSHIIWNDHMLDEFIAAPHRFIPGDRMPFAGLPNSKDRQDLIAYLKEATK